MFTRQNLYRFLLIALLLALLAVPIAGAVTSEVVSAPAFAYSNELVVFDTSADVQAIACQQGDPGGSGGGGC